MQGGNGASPAGYTDKKHLILFHPDVVEFLELYVSNQVDLQRESSAGELFRGCRSCAPLALCVCGLQIGEKLCLEVSGLTSSERRAKGKLGVDYGRRDTRGGGCGNIYIAHAKPR